MVPDKTKLTVAFDVRRLADSVRYGLRILGITLYTKSLYNLLACAGSVNVGPVIYADTDELSLFSLDVAANQVQHALGREIPLAWQKRNVFTFQALKVLSHIRRGRSIANPYETIPFPSRIRMQWDIYHSPFNALPPPEWTGNAARVLTVHDCLHLKYPELFPLGTPPIRKALDSVDVDRDYIICDSDCTRRDVMSFIPIAEERTHIIPLAVDALFTNPRGELAHQLLQSVGVVPGKYVLALAQPEPRKNILRLAKAFHRIRTNPAFSDYVLILVAAGSHLNTISGELQASGLPKSSFEIVVGIDDETLSGLYGCAALFAYVSLYEGFGIPVLEAMSAGCPVVVSNTSSLPEVAADAGQYVDPTSVEEIAAGLTRVLGNESVRESMIARGKKRAKVFSWEKTAAMTLDFYEQVFESILTCKKRP